MQRQLAAILAADVVGYSRLMGADEGGTLAELKRHRDEIVDPKAAQHHGRIVKLMGDGILMEFGSVVDAVLFAVDVQIAMAESNASTSEERRVVYRIGINLGDIVHQEDDIYGDGVNVAARLEGLAEPGGICISRSARDQIRDKLDLTLDDQGEIEVKNIARPVRVFRVLIDDNAHALATPVVVQTAVVRPNRLPIYFVMAAAIVLAVGVAWWQPWSPNVEQTEKSQLALALPDKPSIAVLPFDNLSEDKAKDYFADGLTEDLITNLSLNRELFVISRNSTFVYKGKTVDARQVGRDLGVAFIVEGSVRRSGDKLRINAQLVDTQTGAQVWAERFDRSFTDIFTVQDELTRTIAGRVAPESAKAQLDAAKSRPTEDLAAWDLYLQARAKQAAYTRESQERAVELAEFAISRDSNFAEAHGVLARAKGVLFFFQWSENPQETLKEALSSANTAINLDNTSPGGFSALGYVYRYTGDESRSISNLQRAVELNPNDAGARLELAHTLDWFRKQSLALPQINEALRLNPRDPRLEMMLFYKAHILYHLGRYEESLDAARQMSSALTTKAWRVRYHLVRAAVLAELGRSEDAQAEIDKARALNPKLSIKALKKLFEGSKNHIDNRRAWLASLQKAGMPEQ